MYELWDSLSNNLGDTYPAAIDAEYRIGAIVQEHGQTALARFVLSYEADDEMNDALVSEGGAMLVGVHRRATEERARLGTRRVG
jgi:hypothetical protein